MNHFFKKIFPYILTSLFLFISIPAILLQAQEFTSTNFKVLDPVQTGGGGYASSPSFQIQSSIGQAAISTSTSSSFIGNLGFEYFPTIASPVVIATASDTEVSLSWTAVTGFNGWTLSGYRVGVSTVSGSSYTFTGVGNVTHSTSTSLTNGVPYYFIIQALDFFGNVIVTSGEVSATPLPAGSCTDPSATNFGGSLPCVYPTPPVISSGPGNPLVLSNISSSKVTFSGKAYPQGLVTILKDGQIVATTKVGSSADFNIPINNLSSGNYNFSVYAEDLNGTRSPFFTFNTYIKSGVTTNIGGIFIAPTITTDKSEVKQGNTIVISGQSIPNADIIIYVDSSTGGLTKIKSNDKGIYFLNFNTTTLPLRNYYAKSKSTYANLVSPFSKVVTFKVGTKNTVNNEKTTICLPKADLNCDGRVNIVDFSIAAFWYKKTLSDEFKKIEKEKLNGDGKIDLTDFSIIAYYWLG